MYSTLLLWFERHFIKSLLTYIWQFVKGGYSFSVLNNIFNWTFIWSGVLGKMTSQTAQVLLSLNAKEVSSLKEGVNFKKYSVDGKCCIIYKNNDIIRACKNQCKHQGGLFIKDIEDLDGRWDHSDRTHARNYTVPIKPIITADRLLCSHRTVKCTKHNWKLDVSTMKYVNPPDSFLQDELGKFCYLLQRLKWDLGEP